jgi:hypothetical protein
MIGGGPTYTFLEHLSTENLIEDLIEIYTRLIDLGVEYRNSEVYLADLDDPNLRSPQ